jgi:Cu/Ag efflux pump CusA
MIERILAFSVRRRWYVLLFTIAAAASGAWALTVPAYRCGSRRN